MKPLPFTRRLVSGARAGSRGFTLAELMIAILAGLIIAISAFSFSKQATLTFARESRVASAQMSVLAGFQRLQADVSRASFMSSPNFARDASFNRLCGYNDAGWNGALTNMTGLRVTVHGSQGAPKVTALPDTHFPDSVRIVGNLTNAEAYRVLTVTPNGGGTDIVLASNEGPVARSGFDNDPSGSAFTETFKPGRIVRLVDRQGRQFYSVIGSLTPGWQPTIHTATAMPTEGAGSNPMCAIVGLGTDSLVNVVNVVEYGITNLSQMGNVYYNNTIYSAAATTTGDADRTELVRREVLFDGNSPANYYQDQSALVVAEYAVDLRFAVWTSNTNIGGCNTPPTGLRLCPMSSAGITQVMQPGTSFTQQAAGPESVRAVQVRLVTRSREADRTSNITPVNTAGGAIYRYQVGNLWARARTLVADVALNNQRGDAWLQ